MAMANRKTILGIQKLGCAENTMPCWHETPEQMQKDAENAEWFFVGRGKRLHAFADGLTTWCGLGPIGMPGHVWVDAEPCKICLRLIRSANHGVLRAGHLVAGTQHNLVGRSESKEPK